MTVYRIPPDIPGTSDEESAAFLWDPVLKVITPLGSFNNLLGPGDLAPDSVGASELADNSVADANHTTDSPVVTDTSVANLGTVRDGKAGLLRLGSTPFEFAALVYDSTLAKWVSAAVPACKQNEGFSAAPNNGGAYLIANRPNVDRLLIPNFKLLYDAGLRLEGFLAGQLTTSAGAQTVSARIHVEQVSSGDTALGTTLATLATISHTGNTVATYQVAGWSAGSWTAPTKDHAYVIVYRAITSTATGTWDDLSAFIRWVSV